MTNATQQWLLEVGGAPVDKKFRAPVAVAVADVHAPSAQDIIDANAPAGPISDPAAQAEADAYAGRPF